MSARLDDAIHATQAPDSVEMVTLQGRLPTGRLCAVAVPADISPLEALAVASWVAGALAQRVVASAPAPRILVPRRPA